MIEELEKDARQRFAHGLSQIQVDTLYDAMRGSPRDLRERGLCVAVHNDYRIDGAPHTFWLMTGEVKIAGHAVIMAFKGEGKTDREALDQIRAKYAKATDDHHHAPLCPANHYHGMRAPSGTCTCGAVAANARMQNHRLP